MNRKGDKTPYAVGLDVGLPRSSSAQVIRGTQMQAQP